MKNVEASKNYSFQQLWRNSMENLKRSRSPLSLSAHTPTYTCLHNNLFKPLRNKVCSTSFGHINLHLMEKFKTLCTRFSIALISLWNFQILGGPTLGWNGLKTLVDAPGTFQKIVSRGVKFPENKIYRNFFRKMSIICRKNWKI